MARILFVPHAPATPLRTRAAELARALARLGHDVDIYARNLQPRGLSLFGKAAWHAGELLRSVNETEVEPHLRYVRLPTAHRVGPLVSLTDTISTALLNRRRYTATVSSAYGGPAPRVGRYIYDLVDDHNAGYQHAGDPETGQRADTYVGREVKVADLVTVSGLVLADLVRSRYGRNPQVIPNGADITAIRRALEQMRSSSVLAEHQTRPVIGYVGGLDHFVRIDLLVRAVQRLRRGGIEARVVIVGDGPALRGWSVPDWVEQQGVRAPREIPSFLARFLVGVVPFEVSPFTDAALPLKVIEYGAARMMCVSSPLAELKRQALPWVILAELDEAQWADALAAALTKAWQPAWDVIAERFDWKTSAQQLAHLALGR